VVSILVLEIICCKKEGKLGQMKLFWVSLVLLFTAQVFSQLDLKRIWCEPENVFLHGHAIWHVIASIALFFLAIHFSRILKDK
jgi:hypothetical protein